MFFVQIAGHLGRDPETRFTPNGQKVTTFTVATNQRKGQQDVTTWVRVTVWGDRFDKMISFLKKGSAVIVSGKMSPPNIYTDKEGKTQVTLEVIADAIEFSPFGANRTQDGNGASQTQQSQTQQQTPGQYGNESQFQQSRPAYASSYSPATQGTSQNSDVGEEDQLPF